jgi:beta-N-acetylhexosaminidase
MTAAEPAPREASPADLALGALMLAFDGAEIPRDLADRLAAAPAAGVTLFRHVNVVSAGQVRALTEALQAAARPWLDDGPLLIAADQEGGQLRALGDLVTPFAGSMALGAAGDVALTERVARAIGVELRALGVNVCYAPVCDLAIDPLNHAVAIRSFGDDPAAVAGHVAATVRGLQGAGVAAALKHFPGLGGVSADTHEHVARLDAEAELLRDRELVPFRAGIAAGARLVMSAHLAVPAVTGDPVLPSTLSRRVMTELLRDELGFEGVSITDALDMGALAQGSEQILDVLAARRAGVDLLLAAPDAEARARIESGLRHAAARGLIDASLAGASQRRLRELRRWLASRPDVEPGEDHAALAAEVAGRSLTLVRTGPGTLPLTAGARIAAIMPAPTDMTPADTSSTVSPGLGAALRAVGLEVEEVVVPHAPMPADLAGAVAAVERSTAVVVGTTAALGEPGQAGLVDALVGTGRPVVTVSLRTPFDLAAYPRATTHVAAYGLLPPTLAALAEALVGRAPFVGRLPAAIPGLHPAGHGIRGDS